jgi:UDP-N-acetylglucosamine 1-carboxyvinyltransferase
VKSPEKLKAVDIKTQPFPGFPTDMQSQLISLLSLAEGTSVVTESVFENRFMHVHELKRMGADIRLEGSSAIISGVPKLQGAPVKARDLRAGAALLIAGLKAEGETLIEDIERYIERGYEGLDSKLRSLGADIRELKNIAEYEEEPDQ